MDNSIIGFMWVLLVALAFALGINLGYRDAIDRIHIIIHKAATQEEDEDDEQADDHR